MDIEQNDSYTFEEGFVFAEALAKKAKNEALLLGSNNHEAEEISQKKYNEVSRRHAIEYLKHLDNKLNSLSNQTIANLLKALIAMGLTIEDDEELEYWISILTQQTLDRIAMYFNQRDSSSLWKQITSRPREINLLRQIKNYSPKEIQALSEMIQCLDKINIAKTKNINIAQKRSDTLKRIDKTLKNDLKIKNLENQRSKHRYRNKNKQTEETNEDPSDMLKNKMTAEGIEVNGRYWNHVISNFEATADKTEFAKHWTIDNELRQYLDVQKENENETKTQDEYNKIKEIEQQSEQQEIEKTQKNKAEQDAQNNNNDYAEMIKVKRGIKEDKKKSNENKDKGKYSENSKNNSSDVKGASISNQNSGR